MGDLHNRKNQDYAREGKPTGNFDRVARFMRMYPKVDWAQPQMVAVIYLMKQFDALMWMENVGHYSLTGEGKIERLMDMAIYTGIMYCQEKDKLDGEYKDHVASTAPAECESVREGTGERAAVPTTEGLNRATGYPGADRDPTERDYIVGPPATPGSSPSRLGGRPDRRS
jgi:hypothetical protein